MILKPGAWFSSAEHCNKTQERRHVVEYCIAESFYFRGFRGGFNFRGFRGDFIFADFHVFVTIITRKCVEIKAFLNVFYYLGCQQLLI